MRDPLRPRRYARDVAREAAALLLELWLRSRRLLDLHECVGTGSPPRTSDRVDRGVRTRNTCGAALQFNATRIEALVLLLRRHLGLDPGLGLLLDRLCFLGRRLPPLRGSDRNCNHNDEHRHNTKAEHGADDDAEDNQRGFDWIIFLRFLARNDVGAHHCRWLVGVPRHRRRWCRLWRKLCRG